MTTGKRGGASRPAMLAVYVPSSSAPEWLDVAPRSGIVGTPQEGTTPRSVLIDFEGNLYGAANLGRYVERVRQAAGRHEQRYPTVARCVVHATALRQVGWFDADAGVVHVDDRTSLARWLGCDWDELPESELVA